MKSRIAIITPLYYPSMGGVQIFAHLLAKYSARQGSSVRVYTSQMADHNELNPRRFQHIDHFSPEETKDSVEIRRFPCGGVVDFILGMAYALSVKLKLPVQNSLYTWYRFFGSRPFRILRDLETFKPDIIITMPFAEELVMIALMAQKKTKAKLVVYSSLHPDSLKFHLSKTSVRDLNKQDVVFANTEFERQYLIASGVDTGRAQVSSVAIDMDELKKPFQENEVDPEVLQKLRGKKFVFYLGRKHEGKGVECLIQAVDKAHQECPEVSLVLAGETADYFTRDWLPRMSKTDYMFNLNEVKAATKNWLLKNATVFSMVSRVDSFGIVYFESWFNRVPVIGADLGATRCVIDNGKDGYLVPYNDVQALSDKIVYLFKNPSTALSLGNHGYEKAMKMYSDDAVERGLFEAIQRISK